MSKSSSPQRRLSPDVHYDDSRSLPAFDRSPLNYPISRTVAIIKPHALRHRFDIERRIQEAGFEIVKERQMEFDTETDPDTLFEIFGEDAASFSEGPVWVYVLERRRAVEVWNTLMGDRDPNLARRQNPNSLRALFGISAEQNSVMGSPDLQAAETQIASLFVSSPIFPTTELPEDQYGTISSVSSSVLSALRKDNDDGVGYASSDATNPTTLGGSSVGGKPSPNGNSSFRARPVPATNVQPDIIPRMTRSAALRAGVQVEKTESGPRSPISKERQKEIFANVPGHKRTGITVSSTAPPTIAPRMTRAASLRLGMKPAETATQMRRRTLSTEDAVKATFDGVPGHKRRESISVASTKAPTMAPRLNKSAALRQQKEQAPPSSFMFRGPSTPKRPPGLSRSTPSEPPSTSSRRQTMPPARPASQASQTTVSRAIAPRASSVAGHISSVPAQKEIASARPRPSNVIAPPSITPRTNRSAMLRAAKQEAENAAAAAALAKKNARPRVAPSSFKPITAV